MEGSKPWDTGCLLFHVGRVGSVGTTANMQLVGRGNSNVNNSAYKILPTDARIHMGQLGGTALYCISISISARGRERKGDNGQRAGVSSIA